jgi:hypothetical protein
MSGGVPKQSAVARSRSWTATPTATEGPRMATILACDMSSAKRIPRGAAMSKSVKLFRNPGFSRKAGRSVTGCRWQSVVTPRVSGKAPQMMEMLLALVSVGKTADPSRKMPSRAVRVRAGISDTSQHALPKPSSIRTMQR